MKIALIGDYDASVIAHQAVPLALDIAADSLAIRVVTSWIHSSEITAAELKDFDAFWFVPLSPYRDPAAVIDAINYVREQDIPFLGTCAGYQHAVLEYARNRLRLPAAESIEDNPDTATPLINALVCRLAGRSDAINIDAGSKVEAIYQSARITEEYNCGFGVNREYLPLFAADELTFCGYDDQGDPRIFELEGHRFFIGTAFQPERSAFRQLRHPLIREFVKAAL